MVLRAYIRHMLTYVYFSTISEQQLRGAFTAVGHPHIILYVICVGEQWKSHNDGLYARVYPCQ